MVKVITYGTYDLLHYGHIRLLERAKALGDYLIVGVTADGFDQTRGKINVHQSLMERIEAVKATGLADEIIVEEYEGQKIDDIIKYDVDIFTVGDDWQGKFDYLNEYCKVVYLERTEGISSSEIRSKEREISLGLIGESQVLNKIINESKFVNGIKISGIYALNTKRINQENLDSYKLYSSYDELLNNSDAIYIISRPKYHYEQIKKALLNNKHVMCEAPISTSKEETEELFALAKERGLILFTAIKTAYSTAYNRLKVLVKSGKIGKVISVDATCTSLESRIDENTWSSFLEWGPTALLPIFQLLGTDYLSKSIISHIENDRDKFTKIDFRYETSVASLKVANGAKSEGDLVITGTKGYIYVPAPWWKMDYFEVRYENQSSNQRYFYQLDGEGIRYELVAFAKAIETKKNTACIIDLVSSEIANLVNDFIKQKDVKLI